MKIAIVHEWLQQYAGSERVLEQLIDLFPSADLFALVDFMPERERGMLGGRTVQTTFIQKLPFAKRWFRNYLGLMPIAIEQLPMSGYDLVISSSHAVAKGVLTGPGQVHVSYVHSPMRYAWDLQSDYLRQSKLDRGLKGLYARWLLHRLRNWDTRTSNGVDVFVANSGYIAHRINKVYRRQAEIVPPPVDLARFPLGSLPRDGYLIASRFVPYKHVPLVVEAFRRMPDRKLTVIGDGPERAEVFRQAAGAANITVLAPVSGEELAKRLASARAFVFAAVEDFGITMVEAQACGTPVIALGKGGACEIVADLDEDEPTGVLFSEQTAESIIDAVERFEAAPHGVSPLHCHLRAQRFSVKAFKEAMLEIVDRAMAEHHGVTRMKNAKRLLKEAAASAADLPGIPVTHDKTRKALATGQASAELVEQHS
jgi:glycosyltransferase involved in cell wall biosynthesis